MTRNILEACGLKLKIRVWTDSAAAKGIGHREGVGKVRHLEVRHLWLQDYIRRGEVSLHKTKGTENKSDIGTKYLSGPDIQRLLKLTSLRPSSGWQHSNGALSVNLMELMLVFMLNLESADALPNLEVGTDLVSLSFDLDAIMNAMQVYAASMYEKVELVIFVTGLLSLAAGILFMLNGLSSYVDLNWFGISLRKWIRPKMMDKNDNTDVMMSDMQGFLKQPQYGLMTMDDLKVELRLRELRYTTRMLKTDLVNLLLDNDMMEMERGLNDVGVQANMLMPVVDSGSQVHLAPGTVLPGVVLPGIVEPKAAPMPMPAPAPKPKLMPKPPMPKAPVARPPPTQRQLDYARVLARNLNEEVPDYASTSVTGCSEYIDNAKRRLGW